MAFCAVFCGCNLFLLFCAKDNVGGWWTINLPIRQKGVAEVMLLYYATTQIVLCLKCIVVKEYWKMIKYINWIKIHKCISRRTNHIYF